MARMASTSSRIRGAGWDHGIENRFSMWGLIWEPRPNMNRPWDRDLEVVCHHGQIHRVAGKRHRDAGTELDPLGVLGGQHQREKRVVA